MVSKIQPAPGPLPSKRKCAKRPICATYGNCARDCPEYEKTGAKKETPARFGEIKTNQPNNQAPPAPTTQDPKISKFEVDLANAAAKILPLGRECIQVPVPEAYLAAAIAWFMRNGYHYLDTVVTNPAMPLLLLLKD